MINKVLVKNVFSIQSIYVSGIIRLYVEVIDSDEEGFSKRKYLF